MPGIYVMALLVIPITAILCVVVLNHITNQPKRYLWFIAAGFPLSLIVNLLIKSPFIIIVSGLAEIPAALNDETPIWFVLVIWLVAPVFEEAIKVLPLCIPCLRARLDTANNSLYAGLALGMGFGLGEAVVISYFINKSILYHGYPWFMFTSYAFERGIITFGHGMLTGLLVLGLQRGGRYGLLAYLSVVGLHALINIGSILFVLRFLRPDGVSIFSFTIIAGIAYVFFRVRDASQMYNPRPADAKGMSYLQE